VRTRNRNSLIFADELQRRSSRAGWGILSNAAHPGATRTNLQVSGPNFGTGRADHNLVMWLAMRIPGMWQDPPEGASPTLYAATSPAAAGGEYYGPDGWWELKGATAMAKKSARALDEATATRLWRVSEELTRVAYGAGQGMTDPHVPVANGDGADSSPLI